MTLKRTLSGFRALTRFSDQLRPFLVVTAVVPLLVLAAFGLYAVLRHNYLLPFVMVLVVASMLAAVPFWVGRRRLLKAAPKVEQSIASSLAPPPYWTARDRAIQQLAVPKVEQLLAASPGWKSMPDNALAVARFVASQYDEGHYAEWAFTPVQLLSISEQLSRRYRGVLKEYVPGAEHLRISHFLWLEDKAGKLQPAVKLFNVYRKVRMLTPEGLMAELRAQLFDQTFGSMNDDLQAKFKYRVLLEAVQIAIDLYGGHFRFEDVELAQSSAKEKDDERQAAPPEPIRIVLLGQVGAGKSSVVNALLGAMRAEVSALPATDRGQVYECEVEGTPVLRLVDLSGLNGDPAVEERLFEEITRSDLVLWVLRANQPARRLDQAFGERLKNWQAQERNRQVEPPVMIGVLNQVDRLGSQRPWQAPASLDDESAVAITVREAIAYNRELLGLEDMLPLAVGPDQPHYNLQALRELLAERYDKALNVQLNRRRREAGGLKLPREFKRMKRATGLLFDTLTSQRAGAERSSDG
jgi:uncharacterized protein